MPQNFSGEKSTLMNYSVGSLVLFFDFRLLFSHKHPPLSPPRLLHHSMNVHLSRAHPPPLPLILSEYPHYPAAPLV